VTDGAARGVTDGAAECPVDSMTVSAADGMAGGALCDQARAGAGGSVSGAAQHNAQGAHKNIRVGF
jgi:hypothetical protein